MFKLGNSTFGNYNLWITTPMGCVDHKHPNATKEPYFEVLLTNDSPNYSFYVDPAKENWLDLKLSDRNPLAKPKDKEKLTDDEKEFQVEYASYLSRKEQVQPLVKLSKRHVFQLLEILFLKKEDRVSDTCKSAYTLGWNQGGHDKKPECPFKSGTPESKHFWQGYVDGSCQS